MPHKLARRVAPVLAVIGFGTAEAQTPTPSAGLMVQPFVGVMRDAYDAGADGSRRAVLAGLQVGHRLPGGVTLTGTASYAQAGNVGRPEGSAYFLYDNQWLMTTAGAALDLGSARTTVVIGGELGAAWRRTVRRGTVGAPADDGFGSDDWSPLEVVVGSLVLRHGITRRAAVTVGLRTSVFDVLEGGNRVSPGVILGLVLR